MDTSWIPVVSLIVSALSLPTIASLFWKDWHDKKKEKSEEAKEKREEELRKNVRAVVVEENEPIKKSIDRIDLKIDLVSEGTLCTLRNDIKNCFYECVDKGYRNDYDYQNIHDLYDAYKKLGGNSFIEDVMYRFDKLPPKEEFVRHKGGQDQDKQNDIEKNTRMLEAKKYNRGGALTDGE